MIDQIQDRPVIVTGPDRSGTSLMFALLASHPNISMVRRTNMWRWFHGRFGDLRSPENFESCLEALLNYRRLEALQPDPERIRREFWEGEPTYGHLFSLLHRHHAERMGKPRWGDKSLHTEHHAHQVFAEFPEARMIHMIRDPRDRHASVTRRYQDRKKGHGAVTGRWISSTRRALRNVERYPGRYLTVRYETLAAKPEDTLRQVCEFIDEDYDPVMLNMGGAPEHNEGNSSFEEIEPRTISTRSIGRYRSVLSAREVAFIQIVARRLMVEFQYRLDDPRMAVGDRAAFYSIDLPTNAVRLAGWLVADRLAARRGRSVPAARQAAPSNQ
jgi:hypothetical protein